VWASGVQCVLKISSKNHEILIREKVDLGRPIMGIQGSLIRHHRISEHQESRVRGSSHKSDSIAKSPETRNVDVIVVIDKTREPDRWINISLTRRREQSME
jgi:hypothetical protein